MVLKTMMATSLENDEDDVDDDVDVTINVSGGVAVSSDSVDNDDWFC
jgi:hypothetical protein